MSVERRVKKNWTIATRIVQGAIVLAAGSSVVAVAALASSQAEQLQDNLQAIQDGQGFDKRQIDTGTFRISIRPPQSFESVRFSEMMNVGDRALGNALRSVREETGCEINNVSKIDRETYPQFGTFVVTTRCQQ